MTTVAVSAAIVPSRPGWHGLLWTVPFTVLWGWLIYRLPALVDSGLPAMTVRLMSYGLIALGLWLGLENTDLTPGQSRATWLAVMVPFTLWAAVAWTAAINGAFRTGASPLPLLPAALLLPVLIGAPLLLLSRRVGRVLDAMPTTWLIALQFYRVLGVQWLVGWLRGVQPGLWALPAGTGDVLTGLFAVPRGLRNRNPLGDDHLARPVPVDRSEYTCRRRRLSECADARFRGAKLDPAARAVATTAAPARTGGSGGAIATCLVRLASLKASRSVVGVQPCRRS